MLRPLLKAKTAFHKILVLLIFDCNLFGLLNLMIAFIYLANSFEVFVAEGGRPSLFVKVALRHHAQHSTWHWVILGEIHLWLSRLGRVKAAERKIFVVCRILVYLLRDDHEV